MKFIGLLKDYNPQALYNDFPKRDSQRLVMASTNVIGKVDVIKLVKQCLDAGLIQATDLPLGPVALAEAAYNKICFSHVSPTELEAYREFHMKIAPRMFGVSKEQGLYKVVIEGDKLPNRNHIGLDTAKEAARKAAENNGKHTMVVVEVARFSIEKTVKEQA